MRTYGSLLEEFATELGLEEIETNELGHGAVTIDKIWVVHLAPINEKELVAFMRAGILTGQSQLYDILRKNLFSPLSGVIRCALDKDDHWLLWSQLNINDTSGAKLASVLTSLVDKAVTLSCEPTMKKEDDDHRPSSSHLLV